MHVMRVLVAPDSFGGTLSAVEAADAIAAGWQSVAPGDDLDLLPLSDGGPGFVAVLAASLVTGRLVSVEVEDPLRRPVAATFLVAGDTAYVESAQACGLHLLAPTERDPSRTTTRGVGQLLRAAIGEQGVRRIVVGLGGSATNDGGQGAWEVLGDSPIPPGVELVAATDVDNPLLGPNGASAVFGPQKGADRAMVLDLDDRLRAWADELEARLHVPGLREKAGAGAAGGLGFALYAWGAGRRSGFEVVAEAVRLGEHVENTDLVITGEGAFDGQSLRGKVPAGVAKAAQQVAVPCLVIAGRVEVGRRDAAAAGIEAAYAVADTLGSPDKALAAGAAGVRETAARLARDWAREWGR